MTERHDQLRATLLAALMVVSVFGGTIAFTGGAAAATAGATLSEDSTATSLEVGAGESGVVQKLTLTDTLGSNGNRFYVDSISLSPETGSDYVEAADVDQIQLLVDGQVLESATTDSEGYYSMKVAEPTGGDQFTVRVVDGSSQQLTWESGGADEVDLSAPQSAGGPDDDTTTTSPEEGTTTDESDGGGGGGGIFLPEPPTETTTAEPTTSASTTEATTQESTTSESTTEPTTSEPTTESTTSTTTTAETTTVTTTDSGGTPGFTAGITLIALAAAALLALRRR